MDYIHATHAPKAIGPYTHAIRSGNLLFCSGQTPLDPETMEIEADNIRDQTKRAIENLELVLQQAGINLNHVVKVNIFLVDMALFSEMNTIYSQYFNQHKPARSTVAVKGLPMNALVEIECIAEFNSIK